VIAHGSKTLGEAGRCTVVGGRVVEGTIEVVDDGYPLCSGARPFGLTFSGHLTLKALA
jgi:hypothetical protein